MLSESIILHHIQPLKPVTNGSGSHFICDCPYPDCQKKKHLYLQRQTNRVTSKGVNASWMWQCKKCSRSGKLFKLLSQLGVEADLAQDRTTDIFKFKRKTFDRKPDHIDLPTAKLPIGFEQIDYHRYLHDRNFEPWQYDRYRVGMSEVELRNRLIFPIYMYGKPRAYLSRSMVTKLRIKKINDRRKRLGKRKYLRYDNSHHDFGRLLGGFDEIDGDTQGIILVEGIFDKAAVDRVFQLQNKSYWKCLCTFGKDFSHYQHILLKEANIEHIVFLRDPDAFADVREQSLSLMTQYENVEVAYTRNGDPDEIDPEELRFIFENRDSAFGFSLQKLNKRIL